ncbi:MAG: MBL fold metallo-hydrolase [Verrucomicrobia bacterium]|nr:MBL fold metallo-hydrolase [Verrucomicrobiota bacterium]MBU6447079.1 MBL fold metallo-hydrolase [Verrucomicrobiota bacterium]MDE3046799.1 MBL fold metallo-hydrolase [Verrucomicrobiota bacterium]
MFLYIFSFGPLATNAILIGCPQTKQAAVVDPALGSTDAILAKAAELGLKIEKILLTHSHWDHFADAHLLKEKTGAPISIHFLDAKNLEHPGSDGIPLFFPIHPVKADHFVNDGDTFAVGSLHFYVIHSPGHSPGSVCYYVREQHLLISGDTLFQGSIGNLHLPTSQPNQMWLSLEKLAKLPADTRVIPGHGGETTIGQENWLIRAKEIFAE